MVGGIDRGHLSGVPICAEREVCERLLGASPAAIHGSVWRSSGKRIDLDDQQSPARGFGLAENISRRDLGERLPQAWAIRGDTLCFSQRGNNSFVPWQHAALGN